eukprot:7549215-Ditylum_brightwellii.AAC.1
MTNAKVTVQVARVEKKRTKTASPRVQIQIARAGKRRTRKTCSKLPVQACPLLPNTTALCSC